MINNLKKHIGHQKILEIAILGSWYGYTAYLLKDMLSDKLITEIRCYDVDDLAKKIGRMMLKDKTFICQQRYFYNEFSRL